MKLNLAITAAQLPIARGPIIGEEVEVYFARENCNLIGSVRALTATTAEWTSAGGLGIPTGGRELYCRAASSNLTGVGGAMAVTLNVTVTGNVTDTAVATFHLPTWSTEQGNFFPIGIASDLVPVLNPTLKVLSVTGVASVANMTPGNKFEIFSSPDAASFTFIECTRAKGGMLNLPGIVEIPCGRNPSAFTKLGRGTSNPLKIEFATRGALEQLMRFSGHQGTIRFDIIKDDSVLSERRLFTDYYVRPNGEFADVGENIYSAEGPYTSFAIGYPRVS